MPASRSALLDALRTHARTAAAHALAPYSGRKDAAVLLLADGRWVPGVRVESASFSLTIPALLNAYTTAIAAGERDVVAVVLSHDFAPWEWGGLPDADFTQVAPDAYLRADLNADADPDADRETLPALTDRLDPYLDLPMPASPAEGIALARALTRRAYIPESDFPVACVLETDDGRLLPGVNVEHPDWSRILCAERNALATAVTYAAAPSRALYLTCPRDLHGTPCGACRQLLTELAPDVSLWMDRGTADAETTRPDLLLPGSFSGSALLQKP